MNDQSQSMAEESMSETEIKADSHLVKVFVSENEGPWREVLQGVLEIQESKFRDYTFSIKTKDYSKLDPQDKIYVTLTPEGFLWKIDPEELLGELNPQQKLVYARRYFRSTIAFSFIDAAFCRRFYYALKEEKQTNFWSLKSLEKLKYDCEEGEELYLNPVKLFYSNIQHEEQITQFEILVAECDKHATLSYDFAGDDPHLLGKFYGFLRHVLFNSSSNQIFYLTSNDRIFESVLKILSFTVTFGNRFDYCVEYKQKITVKNPLEIVDEKIQRAFDIISKVRFLKDVVMSTYIELPQEAVLNYVISEASTEVVEAFTENKMLFQNLKSEKAKSDSESFLNTFIHTWNSFKAIVVDAATVKVKQQFFDSWVEHGLFQETLSSINKLVASNSVEEVSNQLWTNLTNSLNGMFSFQWDTTQRLILGFSTEYPEQSLTKNLLSILEHSDLHTKVEIMDFVKALIEPSENRRSITTKFSRYIFGTFVNKVFEHCDNPNTIHIFLSFLEEVYFIDPERTRHMMVEAELFEKLKKYTVNKHSLLMMLRLLKVMLEKEESTAFKIVSIENPFPNLRGIYAKNRGKQNIIYSQILSILKLIPEVKSEAAQRFFLRSLEITAEGSGTKNQNNSDYRLKIQEILDRLNFNRN